MFRDKIADWFDKKLTYICEHPFKFGFECAILGIAIGVGIRNNVLRRRLDNVTDVVVNLFEDNTEMYTKICSLERTLGRN